MKKNIPLIMMITCAFIMAGCGEANQSPKAPAEKVHKVQVRSLKSSDAHTQTEIAKVNKSQTYTGTIKYYSMEGGFYGIVTDNGDSFLPMNLSKDYEQDGAKIKFSGAVIDDLMTTQQWGTPFKINDVVLLQAGTKAFDNSY